MSHLSEMIGRLPQLYRDGELIGGILAQPAQQLEIIDELGRLVAQRRWFDTTYELDDAVKAAALLDISAESWQDLEEFRAWVHALRNALLRQSGSVTVTGIQRFIEEYVDRFQRATSVMAVPPITAWSTERGAMARFVENPLQVQFSEAAPGAITPLHRFTIDNRGLDAVPVRFLLRTVGDQSEYVPCIVNITTGRALLLRATLAPGQRLWLGIDADGGATATLEKQDVTARLVMIEPYLPGQAIENDAIHAAALPIVLDRGENELLFFSAAVYNEQGLDRALMAPILSDASQGAFDSSSFDHSLFEQDARIHIDAAFAQSQPAEFAVELSGGCLVHAAGDSQQALNHREILAGSLGAGVAKLCAAGVRSAVGLTPFREVQHQRDHIVGFIPKRIATIGPAGMDSTPQTGAVFEKTGFNQSIFH